MTLQPCQIFILRLGLAVLGIWLGGYAQTPAPAQAAAGWRLTDIFERDLKTNGITLVDWDGYLANPAIKFYLHAPKGLTHPATATLSANGARLCFDLPSSVGSNGPAKTLTFDRETEKAPVLLSIFPDRDGLDEDYQLSLREGGQLVASYPIHVLDQDKQTPNQFLTTIDFDQDESGFFKNPTARWITRQAVEDWTYFLAETCTDPVPAGAERTLIYQTYGRDTGREVRNAKAYNGFLIYAYGWHSDALLSLGECSDRGGFQTCNGQPRRQRRSGGFKVETEGNHNRLGWLMLSRDDDWWISTNSRHEQNDFYSIAHHELGHALFFDGSQPLFAEAKINGIFSRELLAYQGGPARMEGDHLLNMVDKASRVGAFASDQRGEMPRCRRLVTKLDLLCLQAIGYKLRDTSAFWNLSIQTPNLPDASLDAPYRERILAAGGIPFYCWDLVEPAAQPGMVANSAMRLPPGLALNSFTGALEGRPTKPGKYYFTVRVRDYDETSPGVTARFTLMVR